MINQVTLVGRLTRDPELNSTMDGKAVTHVTLAVNRHFRNQHGEIDTDFVQCTLWRKAAENTCNFCRKGALLGITGRLQTRHYDNREGKRIYVTEVVAESVRFLSYRPQTAAGEPSRTSSQREPVVNEHHRAPSDPHRNSDEYHQPNPQPVSVETVRIPYEHSNEHNIVVPPQVSSQGDSHPNQAALTNTNALAVQNVQTVHNAEDSYPVQPVQLAGAGKPKKEEEHVFS
ncbi:single-stranded DNA-binding protein [Bacillus rubiinfantis]|uniref:single-stranded DNA-binding protein n=1 Tax=Bacillus rubiinfantis TaxID=1499680 RepID=UPI0009E4FD91|nr:single-stranded DNA-binding protein [Bacillus rubiinfantis]